MFGANPFAWPYFAQAYGGLTGLTPPVIVYLDPVYTGHIGDVLVGLIDGRELGHISDTVAGTIEEDVEEVPA